MFIVAAIVFPRSFYPNIKSKKTEAIQNNNEKRFCNLPVDGERLIQRKKNSKGKFLKNIERDLFARGQMAAYMN